MNIHNAPGLAVSTIHNAPALTLHATIQHHGATGSTLTITSTYPTARNPVPHTLLRLTLPQEDLRELALHIERNTR